MEKNMKKGMVQSMRELFRDVAKRTLPMLGGDSLRLGIVNAEAGIMSFGCTACNTACDGSCKNTCTFSCKFTSQR